MRFVLTMWPTHRVPYCVCPVVYPLWLFIAHVLPPLSVLWTYLSKSSGLYAVYGGLLRNGISWFPLQPTDLGRNLQVLTSKSWL